jgi:hypothetical protein
MSLDYQQWPFLPANLRTPEQNEQWWRNCFVTTPPLERFVHGAGSAVITGSAGCGKSVALAALQRQTQDKWLYISYPPQSWPHGSRPWLPEGSHVGQIMAAAATELTQHLVTVPMHFNQLNSLQKEFLYWLIEKHLNRRTLARFIYQIKELTGGNIDLPDRTEDLYKSDTQETDVWGQISELVELAQALGYEQVVIGIDVSLPEAIGCLDDLTQLLGWLSLMEHRDFIIRAALPQESVNHGQLVTRSRGRLALIQMYYNETEISEIINHCLRVATKGQYQQLAELANSPILERARQEISILYGTDTLAGWIDWTHTLLKLKQKKKITAEAAAYAYYSDYVPIRLDAQQRGVWRGPQFIGFDNQPYEMLAKLFELRGHFAPDALIELAGSSANLNTLINRIRKKIEPVPGKKVYIQNRRDRGYWLENYIL